MKTYLTALALTAVLAQPATATTFPSLTTIYVASGVVDQGGNATAGIATTVFCSNVSGQTAQVRVLILTSEGAIHAAGTATVPHGSTRIFSTHDTALDDSVILNTGFALGVLNVESTQSGVFCSAMIINSGFANDSVALHMIRVNPHPGTVE